MESLSELVVAIIIFIASPWVIFSLLSTLSDVGVGYIDEWLLKYLNPKESTLIDAPGRLVLVSGFFGFIVCLIALACSIFIGEPYSLNVSHTSFLYAMAAGALEVIWLIPYFYALNKGGAINTTPLFQTVPIFSLVFGFFIFSEVPIYAHIIATIIIISGAALLNYDQKTKNLDLLSLSLMLFASSVISLGYFLFKGSAETGNIVASVFGNGLGMGLFTLVIWFISTPYRKQFHSFIKLSKIKILVLQSTNEGLYAFSAFTGQIAIVLGPSVMVVSAFNAFHPIFTLLVGIILARLGSKRHMDTLLGRQRYVKACAVLLIALGAVMIALHPS